MSQIQPSIIYDDQGRPIGVVLPYDEWLKGQKGQPDLKGTAKRTFRVKDLKRKLDWPGDPVDFQRQVRDE